MLELVRKIASKYQIGSHTMNHKLVWQQSRRIMRMVVCRVIRSLPAARRFKSYVGLKGAERKLRRWLTDFEFTDIATAAAQVDWKNAPVVKI